MALNILRDVSKTLQNNWFAIMMDETTDISNMEQLVICLRWVDSKLMVHEDFIGLHSLNTVMADEIVNTIKYVLIRMQVNISKCRGQK